VRPVAAARHRTDGAHPVLARWPVVATADDIEEAFRMARPALQIGYHDHCFDGSRLRRRSAVLPGEGAARPRLDRVGLRGLAHRAGQLFGDEVFAGEENAVVDFRYTTDQRLTGGSTTTRARSGRRRRSALPGRHFGRKFWDPTAKSCTRFLARVCRDRFGWDFSLSELVDWAEVIDGAQFPDAKTAVELTSRRCS